MNDCSYYEEQISAYLDEMLAEEEEKALKAHLEACSRCGALLDELRNLSGALQSLQQEPPADFAKEIVRRAAAAGRRRAMIRSFTATAAMLIVVLLGAGSIRLLNWGALHSGTAVSALPVEPSANVNAEQVTPTPSAKPTAGDKASVHEKTDSGSKANAGRKAPKTDSGSQKSAAPTASAPKGTAPATEGKEKSAVSDTLLTESGSIETEDNAANGIRGFASTQAAQPNGGPYFAILTATSPVNPPDSDPDATYLILNREEFYALLDSWKVQGVAYTLDTTGEDVDLNADIGLVLLGSSIPGQTVKP